MRKSSAEDIAKFVSGSGIHTWQLGVIESTACDADAEGYTTSAKGVAGGAVRLTGDYAQ